MTSLLVIPGSTRTGAFSKQLARAVARLAEAEGHTPTLIDLRDFAMPLYDGDLEAAEGVPDGAVRLRGLIQQHDALLFVSPEYNASIPAVLKNTIDWLSRPYAKEPKVQVFEHRIAALLSSSPGALGGMRGLVHLRQVLMNLAVMVITEQFSLDSAATAFHPDGTLIDPKHVGSVQKVLKRLAEVARKMSA